MRELGVALFGEDFAHEQIVGALVTRVAGEEGVRVRQDWRSATGGVSRVVAEFRRYLADLGFQGEPRPDLIVVAIDANRKGLSGRARELDALVDDVPQPVVKAIPDPHVERWLLLDGAAFKGVFGVGCQAPDRRYDRGRYKRLLIDAIVEAGVTPNLGGVEYAEEIVEHMNLQRSSQDRSFRRFIDDLRQALRVLVDSTARVDVP